MSSSGECRLRVKQRHQGLKEVKVSYVLEPVSTMYRLHYTKQFFYLKAKITICIL